MFQVYLAGPEVFHPKPDLLRMRKQEICLRYGLKGIFPLEPHPEMQSPVTGREIYRHNRRHLDACDAMIANITPYRGLFADTGTIFEIGYHLAQSKSVMAYTGSLLSIEERIGACDVVVQRDDGVLATRDGLEVERFGYADNLMIDAGIEEHGGQVYRSSEGLWGLDAFEKACMRLQSMRNMR